MRVQRWLPWLAFGHDIIMAMLGFVLAMYLRVGAEAFDHYGGALQSGVPIFAVAAAISFRVLNLYRGLWRYASVRDLTAVVKAVTLAVLVFVPTLFLVNRMEALPRSVPLILWLVMVALLGAPRVLYRMAKDRLAGNAAEATRRVPVLLIGAGDGAELFIRAMAGQPLYPYRVVGVLDDRGRDLVGRHIHNVPILGTVDDLAPLIEKLASQGARPQRLIVTRPAAELDGALMRRLVDAAEKLGAPIARIPNLTEFQDAVADGRLKLQPIAVEDLLGRPQVVHDLDAVRKMIAGRRVLVTGAGGTIGGELTRQIAALAPARLALVEHGEFALYTIGQAIGEDYPALDLALHLADVRDRGRIFALLAAERPDIVFHAAALKHLPLAEQNPSEAVLTNAIGTRNIADATRRAGAGAMVMISTDKAVRPSSVMGLTKRLAETYCQALDLDGDGGSRFVTVRFGNVLGSTGSVVPLFQRQLAAGGPLTVTHPDVERYFMTCGEAVQLVLQAAAYSLARPAERGRIFVLDMGEPVRIVDLARQMIRLAGLEPGRDVQIAFTGLRPGEKLTERLSEEDEPLTETEAAGILMASPRPAHLAAIDAFLDTLAESAASGSGGAPDLASLLDQARRGDLPDLTWAELRRRRARPA